MKNSRNISDADRSAPRNNSESKWTLKQTGRVPPPAFGLPALTEEDHSTIASLKDEEAVRAYAHSRFDARWGSKLVEFQAIVESCKRDLSWTQERVREAQDLVQSVSPYTVTRQELELPRGVRLFILVTGCAVLVAVMIAEWWNLAGFAARSEFQSLTAGLVFTFGLALSPTALKLALADPKPVRRYFAAILIVLGCALFLGVFSNAYLPENTAVVFDSLGVLDGNLDAQSISFAWFHPRWRLLWQAFLFITVSLTIGSYVASLLTLKPVPATYFPPGLKDAQTQLQSWLSKRQELEARLTEAAGNISEYDASRLQAEFQSTAEYLEELKAVEEEDRLLRELQRRSDRRRGSNGDHIPINHKPRTLR